MRSTPASGSLRKRSTERRASCSAPPGNGLPAELYPSCTGLGPEGSSRLASGQILVGRRGCKRRATCTIEAASSCILRIQRRSGGVGAFDPARHSPFLVQPKVRRRCLPTGGLRVFQRRLHRTRFIPPDHGASLARPTLKVLHRHESGRKERKRKEEQVKVCH